jgi:hypothetical protein
MEAHSDGGNEGSRTTKPAPDGILIFVPQASADSIPVQENRSWIAGR